MFDPPTRWMTGANDEAHVQTMNILNELLQAQYQTNTLLRQLLVAVSRLEQVSDEPTSGRVDQD